MINVFIKIEERFQINNLSLYLWELGKEEQTKPKAQRRKEMIKIRPEINEINTIKTIEKKWNSEFENF